MFSDSDSTAPDPGPVMGALGESENAHRRPDFLRCAPRTSAVGSAGKDGSFGGDPIHLLMEAVISFFSRRLGGHMSSRAMRSRMSVPRSGDLLPPSPPAVPIWPRCIATSM